MRFLTENALEIKSFSKMHQNVCKGSCDRLLMQCVWNSTEVQLTPLHKVTVEVDCNRWSWNII